MSDCLWGLLDGMNDAGLAVSLAFGGRHVVGRGFGVPLVVRYLLQVCATVCGSTRRRSPGLPYHLAHTLTLVDRAGDVVTAYLSPDRGAVFREVGVATNHQGDVEWHEHAHATRSLEREHVIETALEEAADSRASSPRSSSLRSTPWPTARAWERSIRRSTSPAPDRSNTAGRALRGSTPSQSIREGSRTIRLLESTAA